MLTQIPIEFDYQGKHYKGFFGEVSGAGSFQSRHWHLSLYRAGKIYYYGQMNYFEESGFRFTSQTGEFEDLNEFFGQHIMLWYE